LSPFVPPDPLWASVYAGGVPSITPSEKLKLLGNVPLFSDFSAKQLEAISLVARTKSLQRREQLFHKGDHGGEIYAVASGKLKVLTTSAEGDDVVFSILGPGEVFGEVALLGATPRTASVSAIEDCRLLVIDRRDFLAFLKTNPEVSVKLLSVLAIRLKRVSELVEDTLFLNLPLRLAKKLLSLSHIYGEETADGTRIDLKLSQEEWGDLVGTTRESVNKQVRKWTEAEIITVDEGYVVIRNPAELEKLAGAFIY
jgi:CRP/FNR family cyclic AMP-dependent transcriptional regulator